MNQDLYTVEEVAQRLKLHVRTVRLFLRKGKLKGTRIGKQYRIARADLEAFAGPVAARPEHAAVQSHRQVEVSAVVSITAIDKAQSMRLTNALVATANSNRERDEPPLRVECIYDEQRAVLKVILIGGSDAVAYLLRLVKLHEEP